jgi:UPF0755 protein
VKRLAFLIIVLGAIAFGVNQAYSYWNYEVNTPVSSSSQPVAFKVTQGEGAAEIAVNLQLKGLIRSSDVFNWYLKLNNQRGDLQAGDFVLNKNMNIPQIVDALQHGKLNQVVVRLPEGIPAKFMAQAVQDAGIGSTADYLAATKDPAWQSQYDFLASKPAARDLEGYLYPDTYALNQGATPHDLVKTQLDAFGRNLTPDLRASIQQASAARPVMSIDQIVILASIVQRETSNPQNQTRVCEVFYNRLKTGDKLGSDPTVLYALGRLGGGLSADDLNVNSPYNTRKFTGLPPGPIGNPTIGAIKACVTPDNDDYLFFFTDKNGVTHFEKTNAEFNADINKYGVSGG